MTGFFSVCNRHQLPEAITLGESILARHPDGRFFIGFADEAVLPPLPDNIILVPVEKLDVPRLAEMSGRYFDFEFVCALRPWFAKYFVEQYPDCSAWVFMAPTVQVYSPLDKLLEEPGELLLTPNITQRLPASPYLDDKRILNIGMFHSNAWIARPTLNVKKLLDWWSLRTIDRAFFDLCNGMCLDQLWLNYAPIHVPDWKLIRDPLWHTGLHNLLLRSFSMRHQSPISDGEPLYTVDFAGLQTYHPIWSEHTRLVGGNPEWRKLLGSYRKRLDQLSAFRLPAAPRYGRPNPASPVLSFKKSVKSELERIINLIDKLEI